MPAPVGRDMEWTRAQLEEWLRDRLDATRVRIGPLAAPEGTGFSNDTLLFEAHIQHRGREQSRGLVARIEPSGFPVFPFYDVGHQYRIQRSIAEHSQVPVAPMLGYEPDRKVLGARFYVMERLDGVVPTDNPPYHLAGWMTEISAERQRAIWMNGLEAMASFHRLDPSTLEVGFLAAPGLGETPLEQHLAYYARYFEWALQGRPFPVAEAALHWLRENRPKDEETGFSWGDARISNILYARDDRPLALLDWEMAALGSPEQDLAWWIFVDRALSEGLGQPRLRGLPDTRETIERYEALTGRRVRHQRYYTIWAGFRFSVIMARIAQQMVEYGVLPIEEGRKMETDNMVSQLLARDLEA
ncbi:MAG: phosphotransferase family protein [Myxococcota bacterium]